MGVIWDSEGRHASAPGVVWDAAPDGGLMPMPPAPAPAEQVPTDRAPLEGVVAWDKSTWQQLLNMGAWAKNHAVATVEAVPGAVAEYWSGQQKAIATYDDARDKARADAQAAGIDPMVAEGAFIAAHGLHPNTMSIGVAGSLPMAGSARAVFPQPPAPAPTMAIPQMREPAAIVPEAVPVAEGVAPATEAAPIPPDTLEATRRLAERTTGPNVANLPSEMTAPAVQAGVNKNVIDAATELMQAGNVARNPSVKISDQIADLLTTNRLQPDQVVEILNRHNVTLPEFASIWRSDVAANARELGRLGIAQQKLNALTAAMSPEERAALNVAIEGQGLDLGTQAQSIWKQLDNTRRASLVVQPATAMRNLETQLGRVGLDAYEKLIDQSLQVVTGRTAISEIHPAQTFAVQLRLFQQNKALTDEILQYFPVEQDQLFQRYMSDLSAAAAEPGLKGALSEGLGKVQNAVGWLNSLNRFQEYFVRRAVFLGNLENGVAAAGMPPLAQLEAQATLHTIPKQLVADAVGKSLELTFAKSYAPTSLPGHFIGLVNKLPGATLPVPFPRFLMNSMEFLFDYSPMGFLKLLSAGERAAVAAGDYTAINQAIVGSTLFATAYAIRSDPNIAGESWYELRVGDRTVDIRPFNPFAAHFFVADIVKRANDGTLNRMKWQDIAQGVLSANVRAGTGLALMDQLINGISGINDEDKAKRFAQQIAGETLSGPLVFIQPLRDLVAEYDAKERVVKDTSSSPFFGPFLRKLPYGTSGFPDAELPTREGPLVTQSPLLRQATGLTFRQHKNAIEAELDRLGFRRSDYAPTSGDPEADRLINKNLGPIAEQAMGQIVSSPAYAGMGDRTKSFLLAETYHALRRAAVKAASEENPTLFLRLRLKTMPEKERLMLREQLGFEPADLVPQGR